MGKRKSWTPTTRATLLRWILFLPSLIFYLIRWTALLPITVAAEHMIVIGFPWSIMTNRTIVAILAAMWGLPTILCTIVIFIASPDIHSWPLAFFNFRHAVFQQSLD